MKRAPVKMFGSRFIDDPHDVEASDDTSVLCGLSLGIVEVGGDCHHCMSDLMTQVRLCCLLH